MQGTCHEVVETGLGCLGVSIEEAARMANLGREAVGRGRSGARGCSRGRWRSLFWRRGIVYRFAEVLRILVQNINWCYRDIGRGSYN